MAMRHYDIAHPDDCSPEAELRRSETANRQSWAQRIIGAIVLWTAANIALALDRTEYATCDRVEVVEINHFHDENMRLVYDQIIYYDWNPADGRYDVVDWRFIKSPGQIPVRDRRSCGFVSIWHDFKEHDVLRKVLSRSIRETWTNYDPEQRESELRPAANRRGLRGPPGFMPSDDPKTSAPPNVVR